MVCIFELQQPFFIPKIHTFLLNTNLVCIYKQISPLIYFSIHTKLQIRLFGMYFYIPTVFLIIKNTYHFVNYQFSMYLQTFLLKNFPFIHTILQFWDLVCILQMFLLRKSPFIHTTKNNTVHFFPHSEFTSLTTSIPPHNPPSP